MCSSSSIVKSIEIIHGFLFIYFDLLLIKIISNILIENNYSKVIILLITFLKFILITLVFYVLISYFISSVVWFLAGMFLALIYGLNKFIFVEFLKTKILMIFSYSIVCDCCSE